MRNLRHIIEGVILVPHELCHYLMARLLGVQANLHWDHVVPHNPTPLQALLITSAPIVAGVLAMAGLVRLGYELDNAAFMLSAVVMFVVWEIGCYNDFIKLSGRIARWWQKAQGAFGARPGWANLQPLNEDPGGGKCRSE